MNKKKKIIKKNNKKPQKVKKGSNLGYHTFTEQPLKPLGHL